MQLGIFLLACGLALSLAACHSLHKNLRQENCASYDDYASTQQAAILTIYRKFSVIDDAAVGELERVIDRQLADARTDWSDEESDGNLPFDCYIGAIGRYALSLDELRSAVAAAGPGSTDVTGARQRLPEAVDEFTRVACSEFSECHRLVAAHCK